MLKNGTLSMAELVEYLNMVFDICLIFDIVLNRHTGYIDTKRKTIVMNKDLARYRYVKSGLLFMDSIQAINWLIIYRAMVRFWYYLTTVVPEGFIRLGGGVEKVKIRFSLKNLIFISTTSDYSYDSKSTNNNTNKQY